MNGQPLIPQEFGEVLDLIKHYENLILALFTVFAGINGGIIVILFSSTIMTDPYSFLRVILTISGFIFATIFLFFALKVVKIRRDLWARGVELEKQHGLEILRKVRPSHIPIKMRFAVLAVYVVAAFLWILLFVSELGQA